MRIVSGGRWTINGRWVVIDDAGTIVYDPPGLWDEGYDLRERETKIRGFGPRIDWDKDPDLKGCGGFDAHAAFMNLHDCWVWLAERVQS